MSITVPRPNPTMKYQPELGRDRRGGGLFCTLVSPPNERGAGKLSSPSVSLRFLILGAGRDSVDGFFFLGPAVLDLSLAALALAPFWASLSTGKGDTAGSENDSYHWSSLPSSGSSPGIEGGVSSSSLPACPWVRHRGQMPGFPVAEENAVPHLSQILIAMASPNHSIIP